MIKTNYQVTLTNWKNEAVVIYVPRCENEKEAWSRAQEAERKYNPDSKALVTKIQLCQSYEDFCKEHGI